LSHGVAHPDYLSYRVKRLYLLISQRINDALKPHGLARSQWQVLTRVSRAGTLAQKDLHRAMQVEPATLTGIVDVLVAKGWIERVGCAEDKRCRTLQLSPEGVALVATVPDPYEIVETRMLAGVPAEDRARVEATLEVMIRNLEDRS
jgi:MarR family transcriptional regulator, lower aerobic nicotinate degradation pathway regulator